MTDVAVDSRAAQAPATVGDYVALLKPRVMSLVVFTAIVGLAVAPDEVPWLTAVTAVLCIAVGAGASGALNMWYDADIDRLMARTRGRPVPQGRIAPREAAEFGAVLSALSVFVMGVLVNWAAAALLAFTIFFYVVIYTMWLKRRTPQNIVIGGAAGAFPPMIGWAAATGSVSLESIVLFAIIFMWTPPHFWALALYRASDYAAAGVPMLPVTAGKAETRRQILLYAVLFVAVSLLPPAIGFAGWAYTCVAAGAGALFVLGAAEIWRRGRTDEPASEMVARRFFAFSILHLSLLFVALLAERIAGVPPLAFGA